MLDRFRTYQEALKFEAHCLGIRGPKHLWLQIARASASIVLNLAEGSCQKSAKNRHRFYRMALGSLRECQAGLEMLKASKELKAQADKLGGQLYRLCKGTETYAQKEVAR